jgi:PIN domain
VIGQKAVKFTILFGAKQTKLDMDVVEKLVAHAASVHLVRLTSSGRNALDLTLAFYMGRAVLADPTAYFHIVSKDKDFDPLIEHLHTRHVKAKRHADFATLTFSGSTKTPPAQTETLVSRVLNHLRKNAKNRPKSKKTLVSHLRTLAGKEGTEADVSALIDTLGKDGHVKIGEKDAVTYHL